jgi:hypothetical protein
LIPTCQAQQENDKIGQPESMIDSSIRKALTSSSSPREQASSATVIVFLSQNLLLQKLSPIPQGIGREHAMTFLDDWQSDF